MTSALYSVVICVYTMTITLLENKWKIAQGSNVKSLAHDIQKNI